MKIHRFLVKYDINPPEVEIIEKDLVNQIFKVLRLKEGEKIILGDGKCNEYLTEILSLNNNKIVVKILNKTVNDSEPIKEVRLYCAILKKENFELVVQKATEIGINEIIPLITSRTIKTGLNLNRLNIITKEAAELSGRGIIPNIYEPIEYKKALNRDGINILYHTNNQEPYTVSSINNSKINIFIGPEGGFTDEEIQLAIENNFNIKSLGPLILRAETAAIIASYLEIYK